MSGVGDRGRASGAKCSQTCVFASSRGGSGDRGDSV